MPRELSNRVRFGNENETSNEIVVEASGPCMFKIRLGFLKHGNRYRLEIPLPESLENASLPANDRPDQDCKFIAITRADGNLLLEVEFSARRIYKIEEELTLKSTDGPIRCLLTASVLGPDKGTPLLKNGIHLLGRLPMEERGSSDEGE